MNEQQQSFFEVMLLEHGKLVNRTSQHQANNFFAFIFSIFEWGSITKHFNDWSSGETAKFVSPLSQRSPRLCLGEHWGSQGNKTLCVLWGKSLSV